MLKEGKEQGGVATPSAWKDNGLSLETIENLFLVAEGTSLPLRYIAKCPPIKE